MQFWRSFDAWCNFGAVLTLGAVGAVLALGAVLVQLCRSFGAWCSFGASFDAVLVQFWSVLALGAVLVQFWCISLLRTSGSRLRTAYNPNLETSDLVGSHKIHSSTQTLS